MFDDYMRRRFLLLVSPCGLCCTDTEFLPLIIATGRVLVGVWCNYSRLIIQSWVSLEKWSQPDLFHRYKQAHIYVPVPASVDT